MLWMVMVETQGLILDWIKLDSHQIDSTGSTYLRYISGENSGQHR